MPGLDAIAASTVIDQLRGAVEAASFTVGENQPIGVTVSIGAAPHMVDDTPDTLFQRADAALDSAKHAGRNRTRLAA